MNEAPRHPYFTLKQEGVLNAAHLIWVRRVKDVGLGPISKAASEVEPRFLPVEPWENSLWEAMRRGES